MDYFVILIFPGLVFLFVCALGAVGGRVRMRRFTTRDLLVATAAIAGVLAVVGAMLARRP
jgi:hypothetical protein